MSTFILVDTNSLIHRAKWSVQGNVDLRSGMALSIILFSIRKMWDEFDADHIVFALDGSSWRHEYFPEYKIARKVKSAARTEKEVEEDQYFWEVINSLTDFFKNRTNCTVLHNNGIEADDFIARWIDLHPNDQHVIVSTDSDFVQLISDNVFIYNGVNETYLRKDGVFNKNGEKTYFKFKNDGKLSIPKSTPKNAVIPELDDDWIERSLFVKLMRGDAGDGVFTAVIPGTRQTKLNEAFDDRKNKGYLWNNLMLESWVDHSGEEKRVIDRYNFNKILIDLRAQPQEIIDLIDEIIVDHIAHDEKKQQVGTWFLKFCVEHDLNKVAAHSKEFASFLNKGYPKEDLNADRE